MRAFLLFTICTLSVQPAIAWGDVGHRAIAYLAEKHLTRTGSDLVNELLANDKGFDISDAATWADTIKWKRPLTRPLHYINPNDEPPNSCSVSYPDDCPAEGCIISLMANMTHQITDKKANETEKKEALMFLIHLFGDLHQPLHVTGVARGGNDIRVCFDAKAPCDDDNKKWNLHSVWDTAIPHKINGIKHSLKHNPERLASAKWADRLHQENRPRPIDTECAITRQPLKCIKKWATESNQLNCDFVMERGIEWLEENDLGGEYYEVAAPIVDEQIFKAAIRLAGWINALAARAAADEFRGVHLQGDL
ncbi:S1/P1 nuclease [Aspergillus luchuensis]|uniref:Uncharacterized protein n=2 Tax=Aspergillus kawachii TaxID=1069201 RepID=A0A7R7WM08_ASPKA|nr:uncharacterized protein AKAW2_80705A [Aspergillus luchuensis]BCS04904.1 hypothetical protein AKAW2_80705A [Aspergillus luchuensis]BCS16465.1 hypothetical protein ALUC_80672A [Aspergillus luchuensis]GAA85886.1 S1/P1 Nuclease [Aspergillus luchuensis IFO 4308]